MKLSLKTIAAVVLASTTLTSCSEIIGAIIFGAPVGIAVAPFLAPLIFILTLSSYAPGADFGFNVITQMTTGQREIYQAEVTLPQDATFNGFDIWGAGALIGGYGFNFDGNEGVDRYLPVYAISHEMAYADSNLNGSFESDREPAIEHSGGATSPHMVKVTVPYGGDANQTTGTAQFDSEIIFGMRTGLFTHGLTTGAYTLSSDFISVDPDTDGADDNAGDPPITISATRTISIGNDTLAAAVTPGIRSGVFDTPLTAFASIINAGTSTATGCKLSLLTPLPATFSYQTTDSATNALTGTPNTPVDINAAAIQSYLITLTPMKETFMGNTRPFPNQPVEFLFDCENTQPASVKSDINTLRLNIGLTQKPDIISIAATPSGDGIWTLDPSNGIGAFAASGINIGTSDTVTVSPRASFTIPELSLSICNTTGQANGACANSPASSVTMNFDNGAAKTLSVFGTSTKGIAFKPGKNRIFLDFNDSNNDLRGSISVAVQYTPNF